MESHENSHTQILEYIKKNPDLQKAIELLRREGKVSRTALEFEFGWTEWKARKVYEALRYVCIKGLAFPIDKHNEYICRAFHGHVELFRVHSEIGFDIDEEMSQERVEEMEDEDDWEETEVEEEE
ncbi:hypothetical protein [Saccharolobus islandicus]|uniref:hypothetical protein n=1 Tax=Saccharolobus islandicus TaxID=43080 RepID=UPI000382C588|nr:hypothetical protein [Sulfolobus islandicus]